MKTRIVITALVATTALLGGCVVAPAGPYGGPYYGDPYYGSPVVVAPPPPRVEYVGPPPFIGAIWLDGFWTWRGNRHDWVPGRWEAPRSGNNWVPHRWDRDGNQWRERGGHWDHDGRH